MINSIDQTNVMSGSGRVDKQFSTDQLNVISETLTQFDPENLSDEDAQTIVETFSEAGIQPGLILEKAMADYGFDARTIGEQANVKERGQRPPPPPAESQSSNDASSLIEYFTELMEERLAQSEASELTDEDKQIILAQLQEKFGLATGTSIIDTKV